MSEEERETCDAIVERGMKGYITCEGTEYDVQDMFGKTIYS